jgi:hypothetical protein
MERVDDHGFGVKEAVGETEGNRGGWAVRGDWLNGAIKGSENERKKRKEK